MALFEWSVSVKEVICYYHHFPSPKGVLEQKLVLLKYTSDISDVIFHAVNKQTGSSVLSTEQSLNAFDVQGVTIRELTVVLCSFITESLHLLQQHWCCGNTKYCGQYFGFPLKTKGSG